MDGPSRSAYKPPSAKDVKLIEREVRQKRRALLEGTHYRNKHNGKLAELSAELSRLTPLSAGLEEAVLATQKDYIEATTLLTLAKGELVAAATLHARHGSDGQLLNRCLPLPLLARASNLKLRR